MNFFLHFIHPAIFTEGFKPSDPNNFALECLFVFESPLLRASQAAMRFGFAFYKPGEQMLPTRPHQWGCTLVHRRQGRPSRTIYRRGESESAATAPATSTLRASPRMHCSR